MTDTSSTKSEVDDSAGSELSAPLSNYFYVYVTGQTTRLAFAESISGTATGSKPRYHTAVSVSTTDAKRLADLILRLIDETNQKAAAKSQSD